MACRYSNRTSVLFDRYVMSGRCAICTFNYRELHVAQPARSSAAAAGSRSPAGNRRGRHAAAARRRSAVLLAWLTAPTMVLRAVASLASLFKTDTTLAGTACALFANAMARSCRSQRQEGRARRQASAALSVCSIAPNSDVPFSSSISMRTVSPKRMNGVTASSPAAISIQRASARLA
jgi:hypothetical protein